MAIRTVDRLEDIGPVDEPLSEEDAEAEAALLSAFAEVRSRESSEVAAVEIPRYQNVPMRDAQGRLVREDGKIVNGPLVLYFQRLQQGTLVEMQRQYTHSEPVRRRGRTELEEKTDDEGFTYAVAYMALLPWCKSLYYENRKLWGNAPVGTGEEFFHDRLRLGEVSYCVEAVMKLEGMGDERLDQLKKA